MSTSVNYYSFRYPYDDSDRRILVSLPTRRCYWSIAFKADLGITVDRNVRCAFISIPIIAFTVNLFYSYKDLSTTTEYFCKVR